MINENGERIVCIKVGDTVSVTVDDKTAELTVGGIYEHYIKIMFISLNFTVKIREKRTAV